MSLNIESSSVFNEPAGAAEDFGGSEAVSDQDRRRFAALLNEREQASQQQISERQAAPQERAPLESDRGRFSELLKSGEQAGRHDLESGQAGSGQKGAAEDTANPMSALFGQGSMGNFLSQLEGAPQAAKPEAAPRLDPQEVQQIADRILVSAPSGGAQEVRITPNSGLLPGTEIIVTRDAAGMLQVSVKTTDETAFQTLVGAQNNLKDALQSKETMPVRVVIDSQQAGAEDNDSRRRSAGLFEQYGNEES